MIIRMCFYETVLKRINNKVSGDWLTVYQLLFIPFNRPNQLI